MNMPIENFYKKAYSVYQAIPVTRDFFVRYSQCILLDPHQPNLVHNERESRMMRTEMDEIK